MKCTKTQLRSMLFLDIETVPRLSSFDQLSDYWKALWETKHVTFRDAMETVEESYSKRAGIYAEFGKVICVSVGYFHYDRQTDTDVFRVKSFSGDDEKGLLQELSSMLRKYFRDSDTWQITGHNVREFDIPFLCRRMLANGLELPEILDVSGRKPWEMNIFDTLQQWRFGDYKNYTSLKLIAATLDIPSPKDDIEGKDVAHVYWQENALSRIVSYCQRDVITVARIVMKLCGETEVMTDEEYRLI